MTGKTIYTRIPLLTKAFNIVFYRYWRDDKFVSCGFEKRRRMSLMEAIGRLESRRGRIRN